MQNDAKKLFNNNNKMKMKFYCAVFNGKIYTAMQNILKDLLNYHRLYHLSSYFNLKFKKFFLSSAGLGV